MDRKKRQLLKRNWLQSNKIKFPILFKTNLAKSYRNPAIYYRISIDKQMQVVVYIEKIMNVNVENSVFTLNYTKQCMKIRAIYIFSYTYFDIFKE